MNAYWSAGFNLLSAVIGALIGGGATVWAQIRSADNQRKREEQGEDILIRGFVQAIADELKSVWDLISRTSGLVLKNLSEESPALLVFPMHQSYFAVFDANASLIGRIPDKDLRDRIISTYVEAKGFVDATHYYEQHIAELSEMWQSTPETRAFQHSKLVAHSQYMKSGYLLLESRLQELLMLLQEYIDSH